MPHRPHPTLIHLNDLSDPRLAPYANQKDHWLRAAHRPHADSPPDPNASPAPTPTGLPNHLFLAEGLHVVEHLLESPFETLSLLIATERLEGPAAALLARVPPHVPVFTLPERRIAELAGFDMHRGIIACGRAAPPADPAAALHTLLASAARLLILEDLTNHDNVGGVFRSLRALSTPLPPFAHPAAVLLSPRCCDPLYRRAIRVSMGHALRVPFLVVESLPAALAAAAHAGFALLPLVTHPAAEPLADAALRLRTHPAPRRPALLLGAEGPGLRPATIDQCLALAGSPVRIPMGPGVDSLNANVAAAIALWELVRHHHTPADTPSQNAPCP